MTDAGITHTFIPLARESQSTAGYGPGAHPKPGERNYSLAWEKEKNKMDHSRGLDPVIEAYKKDVDRTLILKNLKLSYEERLQNLMQLQKFADELQKAGGRKQ